VVLVVNFVASINRVSNSIFATLIVSIRNATEEKVMYRNATSRALSPLQQGEGNSTSIVNFNLVLCFHGIGNLEVIHNPSSLVSKAG
jgi:hypothetical protein